MSTGCLRPFVGEVRFTSDSSRPNLDNPDVWDIDTSPGVAIVNKDMGKSLTTTMAKKDLYGFIFNQKGLMPDIEKDRKWEDPTLLFTSKDLCRGPIEYFAPSDGAMARAGLAALPERL